LSAYDEIRAQLPLSRVVAQYTKLIPVDPSAGKFKAKCPLHKEKTPSFHINDDLGVFYCFGCKKGGSVIDFIHEHDGIPIPEIPAYVRDVYGIKISENISDEARSKRTQHLKFLKLFIEYFNTGKNIVQALSYLKGRIPNISQSDLERFSIFYVPDDASVDTFLKSLSQDELNTGLDLGVIYKTKSGKFFMPFKNRIIFPVRTYGSTVALNGRSVDEKAARKYLLTNFKKKSYLWGLREAVSLAKEKNIGYVYAVEGVIDALSLAVQGQPAVAYLGSAMSKEQLQVIQASFTHLIVVPDSDKAGKLGAHETIRNAIFSQFSISGEVIKLPKGSDVADFLQEHTVEDLNKLSTRTFEDYYIDFYVLNAQKNVPSKTNEAIRAAFLAAILPNLLDYATNPMSAAILMRVAQRLAINPQHLQML